MAKRKAFQATPESWVSGSDICLEFEMPGSNLPPFTLVQGPEISFVAGLFLGIYLISLTFANRWLIFTDDGWKFKGTIQWFTLIVTNAIAVPVSINQVMRVKQSIGHADYVEQGNPPGKYADLHWVHILQVSCPLVTVEWV